MTKYIYTVKQIYGSKKPFTIVRAEIRKELPQWVFTAGDTDAAFGRLMHDPSQVHRTAEAAVRAFIQEKDFLVEALHCEAAAASAASAAAEKLLPAARKMDRELQHDQ